MKRNFFKKIVVSVLSLSLMFSFSGSVFGASHAANGSNIIPSSAMWGSFSVRDDLHGAPMTDWEKSIAKKMEEDKAKALKDYQAHKITEEQYKERLAEIENYQSYTEGFITGYNNSNSVKFKCENTGWDGDYITNPQGESILSRDNPWGLKLFMDKIPVEFGRYYTLEFDIASDLQVEDKETHVVSRIDKHAIVKAYDNQSPGDPAADFEAMTIDGVEVSPNSEFVIKKTPDGEELVKTHVSATFKIPDSNDAWSSTKSKGLFTQMGIMFALGTFLKTQPNETAAKGHVYVSDFKVLAGTQYTVKYYDGSALKATRYVNEYDPAVKVALKKKGQTLDGYTNIATGKKYSFGASVTQDLNLRAIWKKTPKPTKASFKAASKKKKKVTVTFKKNLNAKGYQVKYSYSKKFKKKKKYKTKMKTTSSTSKYTIKSLKSSKVLYVKARAFNKDSCGNKVYGKWSKRKTVYIK